MLFPEVQQWGCSSCYLVCLLLGLGTTLFGALGYAWGLPLAQRSRVTSSGALGTVWWGTNPRLPHAEQVLSPLNPLPKLCRAF